MKIAIDAREYSTSTGRYIERLLHYLMQTKSEHHFLVLLKTEDMGKFKPVDDRFEAIECNHQEFTFAEQLSFIKQLVAIRADLVHFGMTHQPVLYMGKTVTTMHDLTTFRFYNPAKNKLIFGVKQKVYGEVIKRVAKKSRFIITPSEFVKNDLVKFSGITPTKVTVTYEAADAIKEAPTPLPDLQNSKFIMYVGRPTPHKNLERLIEAFSSLRATHPDLKLVLVGKKDSNYARTEAGVAKRGLEGVVFSGFASEGQLRWLYENTAAYVFPSLSEGFGLPGLEAMTHGAPVVSSNATCLPEVYGNAAQYFDPLNVQDMEDAINNVLTDEKLRQKLIEAGHKQAAKYSWKRMAEQTLEVYNKALKN
jgi:glycosyltransferase involved in cell wall biosynthesis